MSTPRPAEGPTPRDNTSLDAFFAEADDILERWNGSYDSGQWSADGSHQPKEIRGDYYLQDRQEPGRIRAPHAHFNQPSRPVREEDNPGWYTPGYEDLVMRWWLADVYYAGRFGLIEQQQAEEIRNGWPSCQAPDELNTLIKYVTNRDHHQLVGELNAAMATATMLANEIRQAESDAPMAVMYPSGYLHFPGQPLQAPSWDECLLPLPTSSGELVRQVYLHCWHIMADQDALFLELARVVEEMVRTTFARPDDSYRISAGLHGAHLQLVRDEVMAASELTLSVSATDPDGTAGWNMVHRVISDQMLLSSTRLERYDLPLMGQLLTDPEVSRRRGPGVEAQQSPYGPPDRRHRR